jgi:hypothetical protein
LTFFEKRPCCDNFPEVGKVVSDPVDVVVKLTKPLTDLVSEVTALPSVRLNHRPGKIVIRVVDLVLDPGWNSPITLGFVRACLPEYILVHVKNGIDTELRKVGNNFLNIEM